MVNVNKLRGRIVECGYDTHTLSLATGITRSKFYRKLGEGGEKFNVREVTALARALDLSAEDLMAIFFAEDVARNAMAPRVSMAGYGMSRR